MTTSPVVAPLDLSGTHRPGLTRTVIAVVLAAVLPALAGVVLLGSVAIRRPLLDRWLRSPTGSPPNPTTARASAATATWLTVLWGVGLVIAGVLQGVGALVAGTPITDPTGFAMRTLVGVGAEGLLFFISRRWLR